MSMSRNDLLLIFTLLTLFALTACAGASAQSPGVATAPADPNPVYPNPTAAGGLPAVPSESAVPTQENPLVPDANPVGDIPDSQVFVGYSASPGNYSLDVPEGWARSTNSTDVRFTDKFNGLSVSLISAVLAPTAASVPANELARLTHAGHAVQFSQVTELDLPGGHAVKITATLNSESDPVTGKQVRLEEEIYLFYHNGAEAMLQLWSPQGSDNVDPWKRISESFQWK
jgi:hypothetical protein